MYIGKSSVTKLLNPNPSTNPKLVLSLNTLASRDNILNIESSFSLQTSQDCEFFLPFYILYTLIGYSSKFSPSKVGFYLVCPTSTQDQNLCLATSLIIIIICYRAQITLFNTKLNSYLLLDRV